MSAYITAERSVFVMGIVSQLAFTVNIRIGAPILSGAGDVPDLGVRHSHRCASARKGDLQQKETREARKVRQFRAAATPKVTARRYGQPPLLCDGVSQRASI